MNMIRQKMKQLAVGTISTRYLSSAFCQSVVSVILLGLLPAVASAQNPLTTAASSKPKFYQWAASPPMGWNSWDCFGAAVTEQQTMENAEYMEKNLKSHGWNIVTIDIQWYEPLARGSSYRRGAALEMDGNGRLLPAQPVSLYQREPIFQTYCRCATCKGTQVRSAPDARNTAAGG